MPKKWIDPLKEANATKIAMNYGIKTYKQIAAENGMDWRAQIDDMVEVLEYASEKGIELGGVIFDGKLQEEKEELQDPEETDDEGNANIGADGKEPDGEGESAGKQREG